MIDNSNNVIKVENDTLADIEHPQFPVAISIRNMINEMPPLSTNCCIYRVPPSVRNLNERVYAPQAVSIGPFHHGDQKLQAMEEHKLRYLQAFLIKSGLTLEHWENEISKWEKEIRNSYAETFNISHDEFVKIVLVDACFVIEAIRSKFDHTFKRTIYLPMTNFQLDTDMMLLENQLPFFVLDRLYHLAFPHKPKTEFLEYCIRQFSVGMLNHIDNEDQLISLITKVKGYLEKSRHQILHFVDLLRVCHLPSEVLRVCHLPSERRLRSDETFGVVTIPKMTKIHEVGIRVKKGLSFSALDIKYTRAVLEIPQVLVDEAAEYLLSNILVLEMCHYIQDSYVRDYVCFMDMLIDTPKDVELLIQKGIIATNWTGDSSSVANLFNSVGYNIPLVDPDYYFSSVSRDVKEYCSVPRHKWKAAFKRDYCRTPWMIASTTAAIILLVFTFIQAICSIIQTI